MKRSMPFWPGGIGKSLCSTPNLLIVMCPQFYRQIFPVHINHSDTRSIHEDSVIAKIKERRQRLREASDSGSTGSSRNPVVSPSAA